MSEIFDEAVSQARQAAEAVLCAAGRTQRIAIDVANKTNPFFEGSLAQRAFEAQNRALQGFCPVPDQGPLQPGQTPFQGGQCPEPYDCIIRFEGELSVNGFFIEPDVIPGFAVTFGNALGPIANFLFTEGTTAAPATSLTWSAVNTNGDPVGSTDGEIERSPEWDFAGNKFYRNLSIEVVSLTPTSGGPDDCGNPPVIPPPGPPPTNPVLPPVTVPITLPGIGPVDVTFSPTVGIIYLSPRFNVRIPVKVNIDAPDLNLNFDIDVDINLTNPDEPPQIDPEPPPENPDGRPEKPDCPPPDDCREEPDEEEPDERDDEDERGSGKGPIAAIVRTTISGGPVRATVIDRGDSPDIYAPRIASAFWVYEDENGQEYTTEDIDIKVLEQLVPAPFTEKFPKRIEVFAEQGATSEFTYLIGSKPGCSVNG